MNVGVILYVHVIFQIAFSSVQSLCKKVLVAQAKTNIDQKAKLVELQSGITWVLSSIAPDSFKGFLKPVLVDEGGDLSRLLFCILTVVIVRLSWLFRSSS